MPNPQSRAHKRFDDNLFVALRVDAKTLASERELVATRWPDYQFLSPLEATERFVAEYNRALRSAVRTHYDREKSELLVDIDLRKKNRDGVFVGFWKARQRADRLGAPYAEYVSFCFEFATRRTRKFLPRPNQLGPTKSNPAAEYAWSLSWKEWSVERIKANLRRPDPQPQYRLEHFKALPAQLAFRKTVLDLAKNGSKAWPRVLYEVAIQRRAIPLRRFQDIISRESLLRHIQNIKELPDFDAGAGRGTVPLEAADLWQSCFGLPVTQNDTPGLCRSCPQASGCRQVSERTMMLLKIRTGSVDPEGDRKRELNRLAQQRWRDRQHHARSSTAGSASTLVTN